MFRSFSFFLCRGATGNVLMVLKHESTMLPRLFRTRNRYELHAAEKCFIKIFLIKLLDLWYWTWFCIKVGWGIIYNSSYKLFLELEFICEKFSYWKARIFDYLSQSRSIKNQFVHRHLSTANRQKTKLVCSKQISPAWFPMQLTRFYFCCTFVVPKKLFQVRQREHWSVDKRGKAKNNCLILGAVHKWRHSAKNCTISNKHKNSPESFSHCSTTASHATHKCPRSQENLIQWKNRHKMLRT